MRWTTQFLLPQAVALALLLTPGLSFAQRIHAAPVVQAAEALMPVNANAQARMEALRLYLYEPGPWNDQRPYQYDFADPTGTKVENKLLANYLRTRKGNCVSMPFHALPDDRARPEVGPGDDGRRLA